MFIAFNAINNFTIDRVLLIINRVKLLKIKCETNKKLKIFKILRNRNIRI